MTRLRTPGLYEVKVMVSYDRKAFFQSTYLNLDGYVVSDNGDLLLYRGNEDGPTTATVFAKGFWSTLDATIQEEGK